MPVWTLNDQVWFTSLDMQLQWAAFKRNFIKTSPWFTGLPMILLYLFACIGNMLNMCCDGKNY